MLSQLFVERGNEQQLQASVGILHLDRHGSDPPGFFAIILVVGVFDSRHVFSP